MSIVIKDVSLPEDRDWIDVRIYHDGTAIVTGERAHRTLHEAIEFPSEHGDLIDRDALPWENQKLMLTDPDEWGLKAWDIEHAPTIIPAEVDE